MRAQQQEAIAQIQRQAQREVIINRIVQAMRETLVLDEVLQTTADQLHGESYGSPVNLKMRSAP